MMLESVELLLAQGLLHIYPTTTSDEPATEPLLFFGEVPDNMLASRRAALDRRTAFREWVLVTNEDWGAEWLEDMRSRYGIQVEVVNHFVEVRDRLERLVPLDAYRVAPVDPQDWRS